MREAKTHLSRLVAKAADGEPFIITRSGKPIVKVMAISAPVADATCRVGFMSGKIRTPENFDRMGANKIKSLFADDE